MDESKNMVLLEQTDTCRIDYSKDYSVSTTADTENNWQSNVENPSLSILTSKDFALSYVNTVNMYTARNIQGRFRFPRGFV